MPAGGMDVTAAACDLFTYRRYISSVKPADLKLLLQLDDSESCFINQ